MGSSTYLIALGSNVRSRHGSPRRTIGAALAQLSPLLASHVVETAPLGPSHRRYANAAALIESDLDPPALLSELKAIERAFGRRRGGRRWAARVLDLDIVLWSCGILASPGLGIPHREFRKRHFVLTPAAQIAPCWRDPLTGLTIRQLKARLDRRRPLP